MLIVAPLKIFLKTGYLSTVEYYITIQKNEVELLCHVKNIH